MKRFVFFINIIILFSIIFVCSVPSSEAAGDPYELKNYRDLDLHDAFFPSFSSNGKLIAFTSIKKVNDNRNSTVWIANNNGTGRELIFQHGLIAHDFLRFSSDDSKIVFTCGGISLLERNGTSWNANATFIFYDIGGASPSFSVDEKQILYDSTEGGGDGDVWIMDVDGSNRTQLTFDEEGGMDPSFSPDGEKIMYQIWSDNGDLEIWTMNPDGTNQKKILGDSWYPRNPVFMPDGKILFNAGRISPHSRDVGAPSIWMMDQDGSDKTLLIPSRITSVGSERASISPNGTQIVFEHSFGDPFKLYVVDDPDGDGVWEDSDGDHVADICDSYPDDPDRGYYKSDEVSIPGVDRVTFSKLIAIPAVWWNWNRSSAKK